MKTLEIVVKNIELAREIATLSKVRIVREKLISKCTLMVIEGELNELMDFNDSFFFETNPGAHAEYLKEIMK